MKRLLVADVGEGGSALTGRWRPTGEHVGQHKEHPNAWKRPGGRRARAKPATATPAGTRLSTPSMAVKTRPPNHTSQSPLPARVCPASNPGEAGPTRPAWPSP